MGQEFKANSAKSLHRSGTLAGQLCPRKPGGAGMSEPRTLGGRGYDRQVRYGRIVGLFLCVAGFVTIGLGWNGMAKLACPDCQLPYLLSGGAAGLGLVLLGVALLVMAQLREESLKLAEQLRNIGTAITRAMAGPGNGSGILVVAGRSTYHRPGCRLVEGKDGLDRISVEAARLTGLAPCRVCDPSVEPPDGESTRPPTTAEPDVSRGGETVRGT